MGFFSFKTADTNKSISNTYSGWGTYDVYLLNVDGTHHHEPDYEGYGEFGGVDVFVWLYRTNKDFIGDGLDDVDLSGCKSEEAKERWLGIQLNNKYAHLVKHPLKIVEDPKLKYDEVEGFSDNDPLQGYFYGIIGYDIPDEGELGYEDYADFHDEFYRPSDFY